jgi:hypothetical protein
MFPQSVESDKRKLRSNLGRSDRYGCMDYTTVTTRFREWKAELKQLPGIAHSEPIPTSCPEWYAGLAVSPAAFSRQLGDMQISLLRANMSRVADKRIALEAGIMITGSPKAMI